MTFRTAIDDSVTHDNTGFHWLRTVLTAPPRASRFASTTCLGR